MEPKLFPTRGDIPVNRIHLSSSCVLTDEYCQRLILSRDRQNRQAKPIPRHNGSINPLKFQH